MRMTKGVQIIINTYMQLVMTEILSVYFKGLMHVTDHTEQLGI